MRVLFWSELFWPAIGGVEILTSRLLPALSACGHEILLVTDEEFGPLPAENEFHSIHIHRLGMRAALRSRSPAEIAAMRAAVAALQREFSPHLVHLNYVGPTAYFLRRSPTRRAPPMLITLHSEIPTPLGHGGPVPPGSEQVLRTHRLRDLEDANAGTSKLPPRNQTTLFARLLEDATWVTAVCEAVLAAACELVPSIASRSSIIYNAVAEPNEPLRPLPFDPPRVVCVGRLAPEKGLDRAIDAFARITSRHPRLRLVLCGEGTERAALAAQAARLGVGDKVDFTGWISPARVAEVLNTATLLLMPSRWEGLPLAAIEAALMARPIVATRVGGLPELIEDGVSGLLVDADPDALAAALSSLLDDRAGAMRMGQAARDRVRQRFAWQDCVDSYRRMYKKLAEEAGDGGRD